MPLTADLDRARSSVQAHPHPEVWERLLEMSGCALRTDRDGGVMVTTDGCDLEITPRRCSR